MTDEQAFLAAIIAYPDDDRPRLVFADWLDEQGGESNAARAEYIRLEVELDRAEPESPKSLERTAAEKRSRELFWAHSRVWFPAFVGRKNRLRGGRGYTHFKRGFPHKLCAASSKLLEVGADLCHLAPVETAMFNDLMNHSLRPLIETAWLTQLREVHLYGYDTPATDWGPLAEARHLSHLRRLVLGHGVLTPQWAARFAAANPCPRLRQLSFSCIPLTDETASRLFAGPAFDGLAELHFLGAKFGIDGVKAIASAPTLAQLTSLSIPSHPIPGIAGAIAKAVFWSRLRELTIWRCALGDEGLADLATAKGSQLQTLDVANNGITASGIRSLAESPLLQTITSLRLWGNPIGSIGAQALAESKYANHLRDLDLFGCGVGLKGIEAIAHSPQLAGLRKLGIASNNLGVKEAKALAASPHLTQLTQLRVGSVTAATKKHFKARFGSAVC